jgi:hypothetical protein
MMDARVKFGVAVLFVVTLNLQAQRRLEIVKEGLFHPRFYTLVEGETLHFKLRGSGHFQHQKIVLLADSFLILKSGAEFLYTDFKRIRLDRERHLLGTFQQFFFGMGIGFFPLNTFNQAITGNRPIIEQSAALVSVACLAVSVVLREFGFKRLRINRQTHFRMLNADYQHLGTQQQE